MIASIAPLTNIALALRRDPTLPERIAQLVVMGGAVTGRGNTHLVPAEFNIGFDPEAAHVVFSTWPQFTLVDWELTLRHGLDFAMLERWLGECSRPRAFLRHDFRENARVDDTTRPSATDGRRCARARGAVETGHRSSR